MTRLAARSLALATLIAAAAPAACSSPASSSKGEGTSAPPAKTTGSSSGATGASSSSGGATGNPAPAAKTVTETGKIIDYSSKGAVEGATVTAGNQTVTTGADGTFSLTLDEGKSFQLSVSAPGYATLLQQATSLSASYDAGSITIVAQNIASVLTGYFTNYDDTLGVLAVDLVATGSCTSIAGATVSVSPAGSAQVAYFAGGLPSPDSTSAQAGQAPTAAVYNVAPGVPLTVSVTVPGCTQVPFPVTQDGVDYTGGISTEPGLVTGFARIFLQ